MGKQRPCTKRCFSSVAKIKDHLRRIRDVNPTAQGFRVRTYWCPECEAYHITNHEKSSRTSTGRSTKRQKSRRLELKRERLAANRVIRKWKETA